MLHHHLQGGKSRFIFSTSFHSSHISFEAVTTFQLSVHPFHPRLLFSVVRARSAVRAVSSPLLLLSVLSSSHWPSQGSTSWTWEGFSAFFFKFLYVFSPASLRLSGWIDVRTTVPQGGRVENRICSLQMQRGKKVGERDGWTDGWMDGGRGVGMHLMWGPSKTSQGIKADHNLMPRPPSTSRHPSVSLFLKDSFILLFYFLPRFFFLFSFSQFFFFLFHSCMHSPRNFKLWTISVAKTFFSDVFLLQSNVNFCLLKVGRHLSKISL